METRRHIFGGLMLAAAALVCLTGCKKDDEGEKITLGVDFEQTAGMQKTYIGNEDKTIYWSTDDNVQVNGTNYLVHDGVVEVKLSDDGYAAVYPATEGNILTYSGGTSGRYCTGGSVVIPATQNYTTDVNTGVQKLNAPMAARLDTKTGRLLFRNLYAVVKVTVKNPVTAAVPFTVHYITLESKNRDISGNISFSLSGGTADGSSIGITKVEGSKSVMLLNIDERIEVGDSASFYLYTAPISGEELKITLNGNKVDNPSKSRTDVNVGRSMLGRTMVDISRLDNDFNTVGRFQVGNDKYISFSPGNLRYDYDAGKFFFADNQYEIVGYDNWTNVNTKKGVVDLFQFGQQPTNVSGCEDGTLHPLGLATNITPGVVTNCYDWGYACKIYHSSAFDEDEADEPNSGWHTLTYGEWQYLLNMRDNAKNLFGISSVNGIRGMVILPDEWNGAGIRNSYTVSDWALVEARGAIFFPTVNNINIYNTELPYDKNNDNYYGVYWLSELSNMASIEGNGLKQQTAFYILYRRLENPPHWDWSNPNEKGGQEPKNYAAVRLVKNID